MCTGNTTYCKYKYDLLNESKIQHHNLLRKYLLDDNISLSRKSCCREV